MILFKLYVLHVNYGCNTLLHLTGLTIPRQDLFLHVRAFIAPEGGEGKDSYYYIIHRFERKKIQVTGHSKRKGPTSDCLHTL